MWGWARRASVATGMRCATGPRSDRRAGTIISIRRRKGRCGGASAVREMACPSDHWDDKGRPIWRPRARERMRRYVHTEYRNAIYCRFPPTSEKPMARLPLPARSQLPPLLSLFPSFTLSRSLAVYAYPFRKQLHVRSPPTIGGKTSLFPT